MAASTEYLSVSQAATRKGVTRSAIYQAVQSGKLPHVVIADKIVLTVQDVDAYTPIPLNERKGIKMGGRQKRSEPVAEKRAPGRPRTRPEPDANAPRRGRGRPPKSAQAQEGQAQG